MLFLLLQTFAWMLIAGLIGATLGCLARRTFAPIEATALAPAVAGTSAAAGSARAPVVEASKAPPPAAAAVPPPSPPIKVSVPPPTPYEYPVTTIGIPRAAPDLVQPQIQRIELTPSSGAQASAAGDTSAVGVAAVATAAAVKIVQQSSAQAYPITTVGIPTGQVPATAATVAAAEIPAAQPPAATSTSAAPPADASRFDKALAGQVAPTSQPRPEPLRPELARTVPAAAPAAPVAAVKSAVPETPAAPAAAPAPAKAAPAATIAPAAVAARVATAAAAAASAPAPAAPAAAAPAPAPAAAPAPAPAPAAPAAAVKPAAPPAAPVPAATPAAPPAAAAPAPVVADDFTRIRAIDPDLQRRLNALGLVRFTDLAKMVPADVARVSQTLGLLGRIEQENWIEQAQILATGAETYYSKRRQRGEIPPAEPVWAAVTDGKPAPSADAAPVAPAVAAAPTPASAPVEAVKPVASPAPSPAATAPAPIAPLAAGVASAAAAAAAAAMASGAAAATAAANAASEPVKPARLVDAIRTNVGEPDRSRSDFAGMRSVRSEALRPDLAQTEGLRSGQPRPMSQVDDLKRVRGIGVLIEKKLNSLGITTYEQIANWTNADIDRISQILDFKGRIERESWIEQARILSTGGHTEFSKRVDRGEA